MINNQHLVWLLVLPLSLARAEEYPIGPVIEPDTSEIIIQNGDNYTIYCHGRSQVSWVRQLVQLDNYGNEEGFLMETFVQESEDAEYPYKVALRLVNVNEHAVGYYACRQDNATIDLFDLVEEPKPSEDISYIYVYVNGTRYPFADMKSSISVPDNTVFAVPCKPTAPDVKLDLFVGPVLVKVSRYNKMIGYSPKIGYTLHNSSVLSVRPSDVIVCFCKVQGSRKGIEKPLIVQITKDEDKPAPNLFGPLMGPTDAPEKRLLLGEALSLNCTVEHKDRLPVSITWSIPNKRAKEEERYNEEFNTDENIPVHAHYYRKFVLKNVTRYDEGLYTCTVMFTDSQKHITFNLTVLDKAELAMSLVGTGQQSKTVTSGHMLNWRINLYANSSDDAPVAYPYPNFTFWKNGNKELFPFGGDVAKYKVTMKFKFITFQIVKPTLEDTGNYTIVADNRYLKENMTLEVHIEEKPIVKLRVNSSRRYLIGTTTSFPCSVTGWPRPAVEWTFEPVCRDAVPCEEKEEELKGAVEKVDRLKPYSVTSTLELTARSSGILTCTAENKNSQGSTGSDSASAEHLVYEVAGGFGVESETAWFPKHSEVVLTCVASVYDYREGITWFRSIGGLQKKVAYENIKINSTRNSLSYVSSLRIVKVALEQGGLYVCRAIKIDGSIAEDYIDIVVEDIRAPKFLKGSLADDNREVKENKPLNLNCTVDSVPPATILWYKDDEEVRNSSNKTFLLKTHRLTNSTVQSVLIIESVEDTYEGKYVCKARTGKHFAEKFVNIAIQIRDNKAKYYSIIGIIVVFFLLLICYLVWKIKKEKKLRKELAMAGLLYFKEGNTRGLNPKLGIDQQADLLPYKEEFEIPEENLKLGKLLGEGAFGQVFKAEARGIIDAETTTPVAVKMVKKGADNMYIKALASELKIMVHMGKHLNIVNLLGACTKNVTKRQLMVIVEYCKFGNIHNYINKHRHVFIDQLTDNKDSNIGQANRGFSSSSANSGNNSDYLGSDQNPGTGQTMLHTGASSGTRTGSQSDYVQPKWRSNYTSEYSIDGENMRPLTSRDLTCWAYQIACGMEYLARRKVLHGDLAARNILLAEDNVVKICDFGLARSIQQNDNYQKQGDSPLPIKWLALECLTHKVFSTQSDVWSYGVVLWEMFSLGRTPYPAVHFRGVLDYLNSGNRLEKPRYANDALYAVMWDCWLENPASRPSFNMLQKRIGTMLEDSVRNYYVELNNPYLDSNQARAAEGDQDYLAMISSPDYHSTVTPGPNYQNREMFFPPEPQTDQDGYLQMSPNSHKIIFSPGEKSGEVFDFDMKMHSRKANAAADDTVHNELTPMLTLNNQPQQGGSESDHEPTNSPHLPMKSHTVNDEDDAVFHIEDVIRERSQNLKNNTAAVTNPTYSIFDMEKASANDTYRKGAEGDKRPENGYMNVVANSLVE